MVGNECHAVWQWCQEMCGKHIQLGGLKWWTWAEPPVVACLLNWGHHFHSAPASLSESEENWLDDHKALFEFYPIFHYKYKFVRSIYSVLGE